MQEYFTLKAMVPSLKKVGVDIHEIFEALQVDDAHFYPHWHFHPQYEIILIQKGTGTLFAGDNYIPFKNGDIFIMGSNIPHIFRNPPEYFEENSNLRVKAMVLYFSHEFIESDFFNLNDMQSIKQLLILSERGIKLTGDSTREAVVKFTRCFNTIKEDRMIHFLSFLNFVSAQANYKVLSSNSFANQIINKELDRLNNVFNFLYAQFKNDIKLAEVSKIANMSTTAFCRFFKKHTNKTMISFLNEIRISNACKLLIENQNMNVSQICFECGFNNLTNFIIQFKKVKNCSPVAFRKQYQQQILL